MLTWDHSRPALSALHVTDLRPVDIQIHTRIVQQCILELCRVLKLLEAPAVQARKQTLASFLSLSTGKFKRLKYANFCAYTSLGFHPRGNVSSCQLAQVELFKNISGLSLTYFKSLLCYKLERVNRCPFVLDQPVVISYFRYIS